jgi:glyoxylase-like metal-dependent hydrolase (beta-lactamase superfamily II)
MAADLRSHPEAARAQAPGFYRYRVGDLLVTALNDGVLTRPLQEGFVRNASLAEIKAALKESFVSDEQVTTSMTPLVIEDGRDVILIDAGMGDNGPPALGHLLTNLGAAGIAPAAVTKIVISHLHPDHISGLRSKSGALVSENADIFVPEPDWAFWTDDDNRSGLPEGAAANFDNVRRVLGPIANEVRRYRWGEAVLPGITAVAAPGHTPGHTALMIESAGQRLLFLADTAGQPPLFVRHPNWILAHDMDAAQACESRVRLLSEAADSRLQVAGYHFPFPCVGYIERAGGGFRFVPAEWRPTV